MFKNQPNTLKNTPECGPDKFHSGHIGEVFGENAHLFIWRFCSDSGSIRHLFVSDSGSSPNHRRIDPESAESIRLRHIRAELVQINSGEFGFGVSGAFHLTRILPNKFKPIMPEEQNR